MCKTYESTQLCILSSAFYLVPYYLARRLKLFHESNIFLVVFLGSTLYHMNEANDMLLMFDMFGIVVSLSFTYIVMINEDMQFSILFVITLVLLFISLTFYFTQPDIFMIRNNFDNTQQNKDLQREMIHDYEIIHSLWHLTTAMGYCSFLLLHFQHNNVNLMGFDLKRPYEVPFFTKINRNKLKSKIEKVVEKKKILHDLCIFT